MAASVRSERSGQRRSRLAAPPTPRPPVSQHGRSRSRSPVPVPAATTKRKRGAGGGKKHLKCHCCKHLSSDGGAWQEYTEEGSERLPVGNKCADCAEVWVEAFSWMSWEGFCARLNADAGFKSLVQGAMETKNGRGPVIPHEAASRIYGQYLEIRQGVEVLNEAELKKVLNRKTLPKYMKSAAPTIQAPCPPARLEDIGGGDGTAEQEKLFCFRDPRQPHRTATLVTQVGWRSAKQEMRTALWSDQGTAVVNANMLKQGQDSNWQVLDSRHDGQQMVALDDFVAERTRTVPEQQLAGTRKRGRAALGR